MDILDFANSLEEVLDCLETLADNELIPLRGCEHVFHAECIKQFIQSQVDDSKFPIICPEEKCNPHLIMSFPSLLAS